MERFTDSRDTAELDKLPKTMALGYTTSLMDDVLSCTFHEDKSKKLGYDIDDTIASIEKYFLLLYPIQKRCVDLVHHSRQEGERANAYLSRLMADRGTANADKLTVGKLILMDLLHGVMIQALEMKLHKLVDPTAESIRGCVNKYVSYTASSQDTGVEETAKLIREGSLSRGASRSSRPST